MPTGCYVNQNNLIFYNDDSVTIMYNKKNVGKENTFLESLLFKCE